MTTSTDAAQAAADDAAEAVRALNHATLNPADHTVGDVYRALYSRSWPQGQTSGIVPAQGPARSRLSGHDGRAVAELSTRHDAVSLHFGSGSGVRGREGWRQDPASSACISVISAS